MEITVTPDTSQAVRLSTAETAAIVRRQLKAHFPGTKFSVKSHVYAGGSKIQVEWTDGPTVAMAERVYARFGGATFDPITDCKDYHGAVEFEGRLGKFGADWVSGSRMPSAQFLGRIANEVCESLNIPTPAVIDDPYGAFVGEEGNVPCQHRFILGIDEQRHRPGLDGLKAVARIAYDPSTRRTLGELIHDVARAVRAD